MQAFNCNDSFGYRRYEDGSADLVCLYCYRTFVHSADSAILAHA